jgi:hypothetical protein
MKLVSGRHEHVNAELKEFAVLRERFRHDPVLHPVCFRAVAMPFFTKKSVKNECARLAKKIQQAPDKSLKKSEWGPHVEAALKVVLRSVPPPDSLSGEGWFQKFLDFRARPCLQQDA